MQQFHLPVLLNEVLGFLNPKSGEIFIDCTLGGAGHGIEIVKRILPDGLYVGIDKDRDALSKAGEVLKEYKDNIILVHDDFVNLKRILPELSISSANGILLDLGVSSHQLDDGERGFSYWEDAPLDMRMDVGRKASARDIVNEYTIKELAWIFREYGEERWADRIAERIGEARQKKPIETTGELAEIVKNAIPAAARRKGPHPARRSFQALRIVVNNELENLKKVLYDAVEFLSPDGKICVISYHSLEDRIVKQSFRDLSKDCECPPDLPVCICNRNPVVKELTRKPVVPLEEEIAHNYRARSAKMRVVVKL
jgi:16S rRNA (cytosine1402-N4)-methyltransferase